MKKFSVPITLTTTGWIEIKAKNNKAAIKKASQLNYEAKIDYNNIQDEDYFSELHLDGIKPIKE